MTDIWNIDKVNEFRGLATLELDDPERDFNKVECSDFMTAFNKYLAYCLEKEATIECPRFIFPAFSSNSYFSFKHTLQSAIDSNINRALSKKYQSNRFVSRFMQSQRERLVLTLEVNFKGAQFNGNVDFECIEFCREANFSQVKFAHSVSFCDSIFNKDVSFSGSEFYLSKWPGESTSNQLDFKCIEVKGTAYFFGLTFGNKDQEVSNCDFSFSTFHGTAYFVGIQSPSTQLQFSGAEFKSHFFLNGGCDLESRKPVLAKWRGADFLGAKFYGGFSSHSVEFQNGLSFAHAEFYDRFTLKDTHINCPVDFSRSHFHKKSDFINLKAESPDAKIKLDAIEVKERMLLQSISKESPKFIFSNNNFESRIIFLNDCDISTIGVEGGNWYGFVFDNCKWIVENNQKLWDCFLKFFKKLASLSVFFAEIPKKLSVSFRKVHDKEPSDDVQKQALKEQYASLKLAAEQSGDKQLASEFNFWQLYFSKKFPSVNWLYYYLCGYGFSYLLPLFWIIFITSVSYLGYQRFYDSTASAYLSWGAVSFGFNPFDALKETKVCKLGCQSAYLFGIPFLYLLQKGLSYFLWFEMGKAIRHRIKI
jgi:uncharacterized protein YjbI with pentapeptide repeats